MTIRQIITSFVIHWIDYVYINATSMSFFVLIFVVVDFVIVLVVVVQIDACPPFYVCLPIRFSSNDLFRRVLFRLSTKNTNDESKAMKIRLSSLRKSLHSKLNWFYYPSFFYILSVICISGSLAILPKHKKKTEKLLSVFIIIM